MQYKGKLYGHLGKRRYFDTGKTADDWDNLEKRITELEAQKQSLLLDSIAIEYAEFCVRCDREKLPLLCLEDYIKQFCC